MIRPGLARCNWTSRCRWTSCRVFLPGWCRCRMRGRNMPRACWMFMTGCVCWMPARPPEERPRTFWKAPRWSWSRWTWTKNVCGASRKTCSALSCPRNLWSVMPPGRSSGGIASRFSAFSPMCPARLPAWCAATPTSSGCAAARILPVSPRNNSISCARCGGCWRKMVNCSTLPARSSGRKMNRSSRRSRSNSRTHNGCRLHCRIVAMDKYCPMTGMTDSFMHCCKKFRLPGILQGSAGSLLRGVLLAWLFVATVHAEGISVNKAEVRLGEDGYRLSASYDIKLTFAAQQALTRGVPLYFVGEFSLKRSRWYWLDEEIFQGEQTVKLAYNVLTRQYRLSRGALFQNFASFEDAINILARQSSAIIPAELINKDSSYIVAARLRLNVAHLPLPLQVNALTGRDWALDSDWYRWMVRPAQITLRGDNKAE